MGLFYVRNLQFAQEQRTLGSADGSLHAGLPHPGSEEQ